MPVAKKLSLADLRKRWSEGGRNGGSAATPKKARAARANGKRGGRPPKNKAA